MQNADIEPEIAAQILCQSLQYPAVAAVSVDDRKIARRQAARDFAPQVANEPVMPSIDRDSVPGAHSCSRARLTACVGSCHRS